jgi:hypothetical protein
MGWFYLTFAFVTGVEGFLAAWALRKQPVKRLIGVWVSFATSDCFFVIWALEDEHSFFTFAAGLTMFLIGVVELIQAAGKPRPGKFEIKAGATARMLALKRVKGAT